jgi:hypothetical protein
MLVNPGARRTLLRFWQANLRSLEVKRRTFGDVAGSLLSTASPVSGPVHGAERSLCVNSAERLADSATAWRQATVEYSAYELHSSRSLAHDPGEMVVRHIGRAPERADLTYSHRPLSELPEIITTARRLGVQTVFMQSACPPAE